MFSQRPLAQLVRSYPILRHVDIYDRQSFIRAYILDNVIICIFMYVLLYTALWYANKKGTQKVTVEQLESEMKKLSTELLAATYKMNELEKVVEKMIFSASARRDAAFCRLTSEFEKLKMAKKTKQRVNHSGESKSSNRLSHHPCHPNPHLESMGSLLVDRSVDKLLQSQSQRKTKSDSNNSGFFDEVYSSTNSSQRSRSHTDRRVSTQHDLRDMEKRNRHRRPRRRLYRRLNRHLSHRYRRLYHGKSFSLKCNPTICNMYEISPTYFENLTPFTRSLLEIGWKFVNSM
ncbi:uncharacterized protein LOC122632205 isoform X2 [Vespula pensylvanica]|uniref:uncharacterized protein LOC122632205 isoform X2 n=1 Tax=Vespula pensylvanica TaxID=30213 RepID=UPI001CBA54B8|nr:uncharacterized protein LOC122632205 isoform X2 [Vespula pensylvanica]